MPEYKKNNKPRPTRPGRPGRETLTPQKKPRQAGSMKVTEGDDLYNSAEDRWARLTGTGRYANTAENNWARMTGTGAFADGGGGEARMNRERMFGQADEDARYRAGAAARRDRSLLGLADFRQEQGRPSVGKKLASRTAKMPRKRDQRDEYVNPAFRNRNAFPGMGG